MSIRSLLSTTVTSTESAVKGLISLGSVIGDGTEYIKRHSSRINSTEVVELEEMEYKESLCERKKSLVDDANEIILGDLVEEYKTLQELLK